MSTGWPPGRQLPVTPWGWLGSGLPEQSTIVVPLGLAEELSETGRLSLRLGLGTAVEPSEAPGVTFRFFRRLGQAVDTEEARGFALGVDLGQALEADACIPHLVVVNPRTHALGLAVETGEVPNLRGLPLYRRLGRAVDAEVSPGLTVVNPRTYLLGLVDEVDSADDATVYVDFHEDHAVVLTDSMTVVESFSNVEGRRQPQRLSWILEPRYRT